MAQVNFSNDDNVKNDATAYGAVADGEKGEPSICHWTTLGVVLGVPVVLLGTVGVCYAGVGGFIGGICFSALLILGGPSFAVSGIQELAPCWLEGSRICTFLHLLFFFVYLALLAEIVVLQNLVHRMLCVVAIMALWAFALFTLWYSGTWSTQGC